MYLPIMRVMEDIKRLLVVGKLVVDEVLYCAVSPVPGSAQRAVKREVLGGGQVWHTARVACASGARVRVAGWCGGDTDTEKLRTELSSLGVEDALVVSGEASRAVVLVGPDGDRAIISHSGSGFLSSDSWDKERLLVNVGVLHLDGYAMDMRSGEAIIDLAWEAVERGVKVTVEPPSVERIVERYALFRRLPPVDAMLGRPEEIEVLVSALHVPPHVMVHHNGAEPVKVYEGKDAVEVPVPSAREGFTTVGAGDRFAGGWLTTWMNGAGSVAAVAEGVRAAQR